MTESFLAVMIPAFNEEATIESVVRSIPRSIAGIERVGVFVIDDGSTDQTVSQAQKAGADRVISLGVHRGLAAAFSRGLDEAMRSGAAWVVNFDADGQYEPSEISALLEPIRGGRADIVVGNRQVRELDFMPRSKRYGNLFGSWVVRKLSGIAITDASSGFRAYSREAALRLNIFAQHTYTHESIIDAASKGLRMTEVPCTFRPTKRPSGESRLINNIFRHIGQSGLVILRTLILYRPLKIFITTGLIFFLTAVAIGTRFLYYYVHGAGSGKIQSLLLAAVCAIVGFQIIVMGFLAHATGVNRRLNEEILYRAKARSIGEGQQ
ncbi:MAG: hypothetical protein A2722_03780 [Candidatus Doudnabacteria bacterium RIFCSPHIGHO2_01_FULL_50_11]|uniref:Glycosyltransferase 2-like domain-containing protein n=1 Tax=Candidatus Doudnabacteria bacterium RIFCSPHIGHO2_01_FULL_50_11 TaxID=1817828 RepID=A0A1F5PHT2_9BACT|nr:MAG: hypothetical protein A2722_03780 [Candidatus Doudnabacteria bacterium RIFCSPHIGHO2_01_FULL_50_11]HLC44456.1 glycosyltransferase family 2 protein [Patescibacteria group bacterium]